MFAVFRMYSKHPNTVLRSPSKTSNAPLSLRTPSCEIVTKMKTKPSEART
jgi:hypothetical protein